MRFKSPRESILNTAVSAKKKTANDPDQKMAKLTHANLVMNQAQMRSWLSRQSPTASTMPAGNMWMGRQNESDAKLSWTSKKCAAMIAMGEKISTKATKALKTWDREAGISKVQDRMQNYCNDTGVACSLFSELNCLLWPVKKS